MKVLRNKKGFTLVELIVTLAILSIVLVVAGNFLFFGNRMFSENANKHTDKFIGDSVYDFMRERLIYASHIQVLPQGAEEKDLKYKNVFGAGTEGTGYLLLNKDKKVPTNPNDNVYGEGFYSGNRIYYTVKVVSDTEFELMVHVLNDKNEELYSTGAVIKNLNIPLATTGAKSIERANGIEMDSGHRNPLISYEDGEGSPEGDTEPPVEPDKPGEPEEGPVPEIPTEGLIVYNKDFMMTNGATTGQAQVVESDGNTVSINSYNLTGVIKDYVNDKEGKQPLLIGHANPNVNPYKAIYFVDAPPFQFENRAPYGDAIFDAQFFYFSGGSIDARIVRRGATKEAEGIYQEPVSDYYHPEKEIYGNRFILKNTKGNNNGVLVYCKDELKVQIHVYNDSAVLAHDAEVSNSNPWFGSAVKTVTLTLIPKKYYLFPSNLNLLKAATDTAEAEKFDLPCSIKPLNYNGYLVKDKAILNDLLWTHGNIKVKN